MDPASSPRGKSPVENSCAVLVSGGLDSAILVGEQLQSGVVVYPLYVRCGLAWEKAEREYLDRFLQKIRQPGLHSLHTLELPVGDLYEGHWSVTGKAVPGAETEDAAVYLPGRNVILLAKAMIWCRLNHVSAISIAILEANPFPDATPTFFRDYQNAVNQAIGGNIRIERPYAGLSKTAVLSRAGNLPLELTMSCISPVSGRHCGRCNKCAERRHAFRMAGIPDPTIYDAEETCIA